MNTIPGSTLDLEPRTRFEVSIPYDEAISSGITLPPPTGNDPLEFVMNGTTVGRLYFGPPMRFEGQVEESAKIFFDYLAATTGK